MNYGLYTAASGMLVNMYRIDVIGNNLANVNTTGYKPDVTAFRWREAERIEGRVGNVPAHTMLERLGGGVHVAPNITLFNDGDLEETNNPLDLALQGKGFFKYATGRGEGAERMRFSRDGRMTISKDGYLVHAGTGMRALDEGDNPIQLQSTGQVQIQPDGTIEQAGLPVAKLGIVVPPDFKSLRKAGENMFILDNVSQESLLPARASVKAGWLEGSAVDSMAMMMELSSANGAIAANARMIQMNDELMNNAINRLGRVA